MKVKDRLLTEEEKFKIRDYLSWKNTISIETMAKSLKIPGHLISLCLKNESSLTKVMGYKTEHYYSEEELLIGYKEPSFKDLSFIEKKILLNNSYV
jgi:hypothetical protein